MPAWSYGIGAWTEDPRRLLPLRAPKLTVSRDAASVFEGSVDGTNPVAAHLVDLVTDLHVWRDDTKVFRGRLGPNNDDLDGNVHNAGLSFGDYRAVLEGRVLYDNDSLVTTPTTDDVGDVVAAILATTQTRPSGDLGITLGSGFPAGRKVRDLDLSAGTTIAGAIDVIADTDFAVSGFEWEVTPELVLNLYHRGRRTPITTVLKYGHNVTKAKRTVAAGNYANVVRGNGSSDSGIARTIGVDDLDERPEGRWEAQVGYSNVNSYTTLVGAVARELDRRSVVRPSYSLTLRPGWWRGPAHLWVGHTTRVQISRGRVFVDEDLIVEKMTVSPDPVTGVETVEVEVASVFAGFLGKVASIDQRVAHLERN